MKTNLIQTCLLAALLLALPAVTQAQFTYTTNADNTITITGYTGSGGDVTIPATINGLPVTGIGVGAFYEDSFDYGKPNLTSMTIPDSVTSIGDEAFEGCYNLTNVTIGDGVANIGNGAFAGTALTSVTIPDSVISIGDSAFLNCLDLAYVTIGNSVTNIGSLAFGAFIPPHLSSSVFFTGNAPTVDPFAFRWVIPLSGPAGYVPATIYYLSGTTGWSDIFAGVPTTMLNAPPQFGATDDGFEYVSDNLKITIITRYAGSGGAVTIPTTINGAPVTGIAGKAFESSGITSVVIPASVISIGDDAFEDCYSLTNVAIPNSITNIGDGAFEDCYSLASIFFAGNAPTADSSVFSDDNTTIYYLFGTTGWNDTFAGLPTVMLNAPPQFGTTDDGLEYISDNVKITIITKYTGSGGAVTIPATINGVPVTGIGDRAFYEDSFDDYARPNLTSVMIPDSVTSIGDSAFAFCYGLTSVTIPDSVINIRDYAFEDSGLTSVTIGNGVTSIGEGVFSDCWGLTSITIPDNITSIGDSAFEYCASLTSVAFTGNAPTADSSVFSGDLATIYYLPNTTGWSNTFAGRPTVMLNTPPQFGTTDNGLEYISDNVKTIIAKYTGSGGDVTIPATINGLPVTSIGDQAFYEDSFDFGRPNLTSVMIPDSVISIGDYAFFNCFSLTNVTIGNGITSIGEDAFAGTALTSLTIPDSVTTIGEGVFSGCGNLTNVMIPSSVTSIGTKAFFETGLTSVTIPDSVTNIGNYAFAGDTGDTYYFPKNFSTGLTNVTIGSGVTTIGDGAFYGCFDLVAITVAPQNPSYSSIDGVLFNKDQTALIQYPIGNSATSYTIPNSVIRIGDGAFELSGLTDVTIPDGVTAIGNDAFDYCYNLTSVSIGKGVATIGDFAFDSCYSLGGIVFTGNAPVLGINEFYLPTTIYYLPGTTGWDAVGYPTVLWNPQIQTNDAGFGVRNNQFGFNINWAGGSGQNVVVEACTNLTNPVWVLAGNVTFTNDSAYFSDPQWTNYPGRFYRLTDFMPQPVWSGGVTGDDRDIETVRGGRDPATDQIRVRAGDAFIHYQLTHTPSLVSLAEEAISIMIQEDPNDPIVLRDSELLRQLIIRIQGP